MMSFQRLAIAASLVTLVATASEARKAELLPKSTGAKLRHAAKAREKVSLPDLPLGRASLDTIELEPMELWAPGAKIVVHGDGGPQSIDPPDARYFRGRVTGDPTSAVFLSVSDKKMHGFVVSGDKRFSFGSAKRVDKKDAADDAVGLRELDPEDDPSPGDWKCDVESKPLSTLQALTPKSDAALREVRANGGAVANAAYTLKLAIETDWELYAAFNNAEDLTTYLESLVGNASVIFQRDLATTLTIGSMRIYSTQHDPWSRVPLFGSMGALAELSQVWHEDPARRNIARSATVMISGKPFNSGRAFQGTLCGADFSCGPQGANCGDEEFKNGWGGAYAFCGTNGIPATTVPDPTVIRDGATYAMPTTNDYWMLFLFTHEVGHLANAPHTNCVQLTYEERVAYNVERAFVDECVTGLAPCFSLLPSLPAEGGTIMSNCQTFFDLSGNRAARYLFGEPGKPSDKMRTILRAAIDGATPDATIRLGAGANPNEDEPQPVGCSAGRTARVATCPSCTYAWTITGGSITSSTTAATITYTPTAPLVTLGVTITAPSGCAISTTRPITTACSLVGAPATFIATANGGSSVATAWSAVSGAARYEVWRTDGTAWIAVGTTTSPAFLDHSVVNGTAYLYRARALDATGAPGAFSPTDFAAAIDFTDPVLSPHATPIRAAHLQELRAMINAMRAFSGLAPATFTDPQLAQARVRRVHIEELRAQLSEALGALARPSAIFTDPALGGVSVVRAEHITELRAALR
jgi:Metallo-peptidase family M12